MGEKNTKLNVSVGAEDIIHIVLGGDLTSENMHKFAEWIFNVKDTVESVYKKHSKRVLCLVDISDVEKYDPSVVTQLAQMMKENEPFVLRTATFGGSSYMVMAEDVVIALSGRKNLKAFKTKEEALDWLLKGDE